MVVYIEKDVVDNIDIEATKSHNNFKIKKLVKENFKNLCICFFFFCDVNIFNFLFLWKVFWLKFFNDYLGKKIPGAATVSCPFFELRKTQVE